MNVCMYICMYVYVYMLHGCIHLGMYIARHKEGCMCMHM